MATITSRERFRDRRHAGRELAQRVEPFVWTDGKRSDVVVLALPRGGVPVAYEVASTLEVPLDVFLVRKLGVPGHEELAMGAIASGGVRVLNDDVVEVYGIGDHTIAAVEAEERAELERRERAYRGRRPVVDLTGKTAILVDDGLATGATMRAAIHAARAQHAAKVIVAVPVASREVCRDIAVEADDIVCARTPEPFHGVGLWYEDFSQTSDEEVRALLSQAAQPPGPERVSRAGGARRSVASWL